MIIISSSDMNLIKASSAAIWKNLEKFSAEDREILEAFCKYAVQAEERYNADKEKHKLQMQKYRNDPASADRAREQTREASRRFRAKKKAEKEH